MFFFFLCFASGTLLDPSEKEKKRKRFKKKLTRQLREDRSLPHRLLPLEAERRLGRVQRPEGGAVRVESGVVVVDKGLKRVFFRLLSFSLFFVLSVTVFFSILTRLFSRAKRWNWYLVRSLRCIMNARLACRRSTRRKEVAGGEDRPEWTESIDALWQKRNQSMASFLLCQSSSALFQTPPSLSEEKELQAGSEPFIELRTLATASGSAILSSKKTREEGTRRTRERRR